MLGIYTTIAILFFLFLSGIRIIDQYQRGVILTFGKYTSTKSPGFRWVFPLVQRMIIVDLRITTVDVPRQEAITKDNVPVGVNAVVYFRVQKPEAAVLEVEDYRYAVSQYALAALRDIIGGVELDTLLIEREKVSMEIKQMVDTETDPWGIDVTAIKMQDIELPAGMKRTMAAQAEAEREKRAIIIRSEGEVAAAENLRNAAELLASAKGGLALRTLETIDNLQPDPSKTVIFALPIEILEGFRRLTKGE
ncbi:slipin family protein [Patescibacteria group bacterium]|nr:slipin family protein [Patescibacteria group bacterium]MBU4022876.1 slipin family protein [Patescibacteria group bacterium]MBU4078114.1 slipin family protein [Patescibacteria group bacterium]